MLLLQELVQGILSKHNLLEEVLDLGKSEMKWEFIKGNERLTIGRSRNIVSLTLKEPYYLFEFKVYPETPTWGEIACCVGEKRYPVAIIEDNGPAFSCKGYLQFREYAAELSHKFEIENWIKDVNLVGSKETAPVKSNVKEPVESFSRFQSTIHKILDKHDLLDAFYDPVCESVYLKLHQECYMDLVIERQHELVFVGHYRTTNGDFISDPVLVYRLQEGIRSWTPYRVEQVFGDSQVMVEREGKILISPNRLKAFKSFAYMFAGNIKDQDWIEADVVDKRCIYEKKEEPELILIDEVPNLHVDNVGQMAFGF